MAEPLDLARQQCGLVEAALPQAPAMERHGDYQALSGAGGNRAAISRASIGASAIHLLQRQHEFARDIVIEGRCRDTVVSWWLLKTGAQIAPSSGPLSRTVAGKSRKKGRTGSPLVPTIGAQPDLAREARAARRAAGG